MLQLFVLLALVLAPGQRPTDIVKWSATPPASAVAAGAAATVTVTATVEPGWKLYAIDQLPGGPVPLRFALADGARFALAQKRILSPTAKVQKQDEAFAIDTKYYEKEAKFTIPIEVPPNLPAGAHLIPLEITFQACGAELCLRPFTQKLAVPVSVRK